MSLAHYRDLEESVRGRADAGCLPSGATRSFPGKAVVDVAVASVLLVISAPLVLLMLLVVKATSRGPAIFTQVRLGRGGRPFHLYKIRSMTHDCERLTGPKWSTAKDPRVTRLGRFLRRSHLDELPQLWNVIRGDMSLVGPRPERPEFVPRLERAIPGYLGRLDVLPGITGLAQVQLPPDEDIEDVCRKVACDLHYIREMGPALDLKILVATALKVMGLSFATTRQLLDLPGGDPAVRARPAAEPGPIAGLQST